MNFKDFWVSRTAFRMPPIDAGDLDAVIEVDKRAKVAPCLFISCPTKLQTNQDFIKDIDNDQYPNLISHLKKYQNLTNKCYECKYMFGTEQCLEEHKHVLHKDSKDANCEVYPDPACKTVDENNVGKVGHDYDIREKQVRECQEEAFDLLDRFLSENPHIRLIGHEVTRDIVMSQDIDKFINKTIARMNNIIEFEKDIKVNEDVFEKIDVVEILEITSGHETASFYKKSNTGNKMIYDCTKCDRIFMENRLLKEHKISHNEIIYSCDVCEKTFRQRSYLENHMSKHLDSKYFCKLCDEMFSNKRSLKIHMVSHWEIFECTACEKVLNCETAFLKHLSYHKQEKKFGCSCDRSFKTERGLKAHRNLVHPNPKNLKCEKCGKVFDEYSYLKWRKHTITLSCSSLMFKRKAKSNRKN